MDASLLATLRLGLSAWLGVKGSTPSCGAARVLGSLETATASWTIEGEEDGFLLYQPGVPLELMCRVRDPAAVLRRLGPPIEVDRMEQSPGLARP